jgi:hypothetical protein
MQESNTRRGFRQPRTFLIYKYRARCFRPRNRAGLPMDSVRSEDRKLFYSVFIPGEMFHRLELRALNTGETVAELASRLLAEEVRSMREEQPDQRSI